MVIDIKMCRFDNVPWGFSLVGGSDFEYPLMVTKVTEGSIADNAGLRVGDIIVRINDTPASPLSHEESNRIIKDCGNVFFFGVQRENEEEYTTPKAFPTANSIVVSPPTSFLDVTAVPPTPVFEEKLNSIDSSNPIELIDPSGLWSPCEHQYITCSEPIDSGSENNLLCLPELVERPCSVLSEDSERKQVEEEIAAVLSGESEMLKEHDTIGLYPKPGVCMSSDVLRTLNMEATKSKLEKEQENRKWTTFLQKPDRPIPKSKAQIDMERRAANAYKVKIVKSAPRSRSVSPAPPPKPVEELTPEKELTPPLPEPETIPQPEPEPETPMPIDSEVPNLEETNTIDGQLFGHSTDEQEFENFDRECESPTEIKENDDETNFTTNDCAEIISTPTLQENTVERNEEELALERQLVDVQMQLTALTNLPSTIQSALDSVTRQLADLLPSIKLQQESHKSAEARQISLEDVNNQEKEHECKNDQNGNIEQNDYEVEKYHEEDIVNPSIEQFPCADNNQIQQQESIPANSCSMRTGEEPHQSEEEEKLKKEKKHDVIGELEEHLERKNNPTRSKRSFGPLTPASDRPLVLPGGRRWYRPKDAYNDEFIAETLSAQAELITGSTLGVNFKKYQKPEKKIDLDRSEVYKIIHHLDRKPIRGIEVRAPMVLSEADVRKAAQS